MTKLEDIVAEIGGAGTNENSVKVLKKFLDSQQMKVYYWQCGIADSGYIEVLASSVSEARKLVRTKYGREYDDDISGKPEFVKAGPAILGM